MKRIILLLAVMVTVFSCVLPDEPEGLEYFDNLLACPTEGAYVGMIRVDVPADRIGLWLEITTCPDDVDEASVAPRIGDWIYISREVVRYADLGATLRFQIIDFNHFPESLPYHYTFYQDHTCYIANIKPVIVEPSVNEL